jgi:DNA-binding CsgD family transcriptional regulator
MDRIATDVLAGKSRVLVVSGEPGVGKTALLEYLVAGAAKCRIARAVGHESEKELAFAGLHQFCAPFLDRLPRLPKPQRDALATSFGLSAGSPPDRYLVGLAVLSLLVDVAEQQPVLGVVDDAQWLDLATGQILAFVARRLLADRIGLVFATRDPRVTDVLEKLPELVLTGLRDADARALLNSALAGPVDERVRDRILEETRGNPLALVELPRDLTPAQLAGGFGILTGRPLVNQLERTVLGRFEALSRDSQRLVLTAAAEPLGDVGLLWRAAEHLGIPIAAAAGAQSSGLLEIGTRVRFRHPLVRTAVYQAASDDDRRAVHRALAATTDVELDPDRRAWHRAHATTGPDENVAAALELSAARARARGGLTAAAAFLERATALTPDPQRRVFRALAAAELALISGAPEAALGELALAESHDLNDAQGALAELLRAVITFTLYRGKDGPELLLKAAKRIEPFNVRLARDTYLDAFSAAVYTGGSVGNSVTRYVARVAQTVPRPQGRPSKGDLLLDCRTSFAVNGYAATVPLARRTVEAFCSEDLSGDEAMRWMWLAEVTALELWDDTSVDILTIRHAELARSAGALHQLPQALTGVIFSKLFAGDLASAASSVAEADMLRDVTGANNPALGALGLAAFRGSEAEAVQIRDSLEEESLPLGDGSVHVVVDWAFALLYNGLGRHDDALVAARNAVRYVEEIFVALWAMTEVAEAAARCGRAGEAEPVVELLATMAQAAGTDWALGNEARARALLCADDSAEALYREAIDRYSRIRSRSELARGHLLYGEWLRARKRPACAREQLRVAHEMFCAMGMDGFAERARRELQATGEKVRARAVESREELTAQEAQIAGLAARGWTNPEIGAELFISARTVEWHLRKVYPKLGIGSRKELRSAVVSGGWQT